MNRDKTYRIELLDDNFEIIDARNDNAIIEYARTNYPDYLWIDEIDEEYDVIRTVY